MTPRIHPVILSGGTGTRLWPMSRRSLPKQFLPLLSEHTMLQDTVGRLGGLQQYAAPTVVCNTEHRFMVAEQLNQLGVRPAVQILEPEGRNTAPAVAVAALRVCERDPHGILLVLASDHAITDVAGFHRAVAAAARLAGQGLLVTFGIPPTEPKTGYGYIEVGEPIAAAADCFRIRRFVEKPDLETARGYLRSGRFLWNSGMFVFAARGYLEELRRLRPDILAAAEKSLAAATRDLDFLRLDAAAFRACPSDSVDYAVMEKTQSGAVVRSDIGWSDVGSWSALWEMGSKDAAGNVTRGEVRLQDSSGSYVRSSGRLVVALGVSDLLIVDTDDALFVGARPRAEDVKQVVERLDREGRSEHVSHTRTYRPWGYFESVDAGARYQVKRIMVNPGQALSLQMHRRRAEHWIVVAGKARVTRGDDTFELAENESTFIPLGVKHRLENPTDEPLYLIEVQSGSYLGEDDIVRFEDRYKRG